MFICTYSLENGLESRDLLLECGDGLGSDLLLHKAEQLLDHFGTLLGRNTRAFHNVGHLDGLGGIATDDVLDELLDHVKEGHAGLEEVVRLLRLTIGTRGGSGVGLVDELVDVGQLGADIARDLLRCVLLRKVFKISPRNFLVVASSTPVWVETFLMKESIVGCLDLF